LAPNAPHAPFTPLKEDKGLYMDLEPHRPPGYNEEDVSDKPASISGRPLLTDEDSTNIDNTRRRQILTLVSLDRAIGAILDQLESSGELDRTVVFFISDNGKHWGEHRMDSKSTAYEESVRVPFAMRYPPLIPIPYIENGLAANIDILPTVYELSETRIPTVIDGRSLIPLLKGEGDWRTHILLEAWPDRGHWTAIHTGSEVYIETDSDLSEFYDLETDPYQLENRIDDPEWQDRISELKRYLDLEIVPRTGMP
jgi:arylsulfatase A-like enzyme